MRAVGACAREAVALLGPGDREGQTRRIPLPLGPRAFGREAAFALEDRPGEGGRVAPVDLEGVEAVERQMPGEPARAAVLRDLGALFDATSVQDHDGRDEPAVRCPPPARRPVASALLLEGSVAQDRDEALALQRHVDVLRLGEAEIPALGERPPAVWALTWLPSGAAVSPSGLTA